MGFDDQLGTAVEPPRQAWAFYRRHFRVVGSISMVAAVARFIEVGFAVPEGLATVLDVITGVARLVLLVVIIRIAFAQRGFHGSTRRFLRRRWPSLILQLALLVVVVTVCSWLADAVTDGLFRGNDLVNGIVLAVYNLTVIAFVQVWLVLAVRQVVWPHRLRS